MKRERVVRPGSLGGPLQSANLLSSLRSPLLRKGYSGSLSNGSLSKCASMVSSLIGVQGPEGCDPVVGRSEFRRLRPLQAGAGHLAGR